MEIKTKAKPETTPEAPKERREVTHSLIGFKGNQKIELHGHSPDKYYAMLEAIQTGKPDIVNIGGCTVRVSEVAYVMPNPQKANTK